MIIWWPESRKMTSNIGTEEIFWGRLCRFWVCGDENREVKVFGLENFMKSSLFSSV